MTSDTTAELILIGTGTAIPTKRRGPTALALVRDGDATLIDPGPGAIQRACEHGVPLESIRRVVLTHHHPDHSLDLAALLFAHRNPAFASPPFPLQVFGGPGTLDFVGRFRHVYGGWVTLPEGRLEVVEVEPGERELAPGLRLFATPVEHTPSSLAYRFTLDGGSSFAFSGDTDVCEGAVEVARGADHYVIEAALAEGDPSPGHLCASEAAEIAARAGCRHLILTHFYPGVDLEVARDVAARIFDGPVTLAEDGMRIPLDSSPDPR